MSEFKYNGNPHKVMETYLDGGRFRTLNGIITVPDELDDEMAKNKQFIKLEKEKTTKTKKVTLDKEEEIDNG